MRGIFTTTWVDSEQSEGTTPRRWLKRVAAVTAVTLGIALGAVGTAAADTFVPTGPATISSDALDYPPGAVVTLSGANWWPEVPVRIVVNDDPALNLGSDQQWVLDTTAQGIDPVAGADGTLGFAFNLPSWFIATYQVTATQTAPDGSTVTATSMFTDSPGSYSLKWLAADPALGKAPYLPTYAKVPPSVKACPTPSGGTGRAADPMANAVAYASPATSSNLDAVTSLEPKNMALGTIVPFEMEITVDGDTMPEDGSIEFTNDWLAKTTSGGDFGFDPADGLYCAFVDTPDPGTNDPGADAKVSSFSSSTVNTSTSNEAIRGVTKVTGLDSGDKVIVELWVVLKDTIPAGVTGNVQTSVQSAKTTTANATINTGNQTVPLNKVQDFFTSKADLSIVKTDSPDPISAGSQLTYTLTVTNNSTDTFANGVVVTDTIDSDTTYVSAVPSQGSCSQASGVITCAIGALAPLATATVTVKVNVPVVGNWLVDSTTNAEAGNAGTPGAGFTCTANPQELCNVASVTAITADDDLTDNGYAQPTNVLPATADAQDLDVSKTVVPAFTRTYRYTIDKAVDGDATSYDGSTFSYDVTVDKGGYTDSAYAVTGVITVTNPNTVAVPGASVTDSLLNSNSCTVGTSTSPAGLNPASFTAPAAAGETPATVTFPYSCSYTGAPPSAEKNTVSLSWTKTFTVGGITYTTPNATDSQTKDVAFTTPTTETDESITLTDSEYGALNGGNPIAYSSLPKTFSYDLTWDKVEGTCVDYDNTATYTKNDSKGTGSDTETVTVCDYVDLVVTKSASPALTRTYDYDVTKVATDDKQSTSVEGSTFEYTVQVSQGGFIDSKWTVTGKITVNNDNDVDVTNVDITDAITSDANVTCVVKNGTDLTVPAYDQTTVDYTCTWTEAPAAGSQTNVATATWDDFGSPTTSDTGNAPVDWSKAALTEVDATAVIDDDQYGPLNGGNPIAWASLAAKPFSQTYELEWTPEAGTCVDFDNTASVIGVDTDVVLDEATETVTLCDYVDLVVTKSADPALIRTYDYDVTKVATDDNQSVADEGSTFEYTVQVSQGGFTDSEWVVTGKITVTNGNDVEVKNVDITDAIGADANVTCVVTDGTDLTVPANDKVVVDYTCTWSKAPAGSPQTNTATATWDDFGSPTTTDSGNATVDWSTAALTEVDATAVIDDDQYGPLNGGAPIAWADLKAKPFSQTYELTWTPEAGTCVDFDNTASVTGVDTDVVLDEATETVTLCDYQDLVVEKTADPSYTRTYSYAVDKSVDQATRDVATDGGTFTYTVEVTQAGASTSDFTVTGSITVSNSNAIDAKNVDITDAIGDPGSTCVVEDGTDLTVPANDSVTVDYTCTWATSPDAKLQVNTATATWDDFGSPTTTDAGTAEVSWPAATVTEVDATAVIDDDQYGPLNGGDPIAYADLPYTESYDLGWDSVAGTCADFDNTATVTAEDSGTEVSDGQTVTLCDYRDLTVEKSTATDLTKTWTWAIDKSVDKTTVTTSGTTATFNYTVKLTSSGPTVSDYDVTGTIKVSNPNAIAVSGVTINDNIVNDTGDTCTVVNGSNRSIAANSSITVNYSCDFGTSTPASTTTQTNRATATWTDFGSPHTTGTGDATVDWTKATVTKVDDSVTVTDSQYTPATLWTATVGDANPKSFTYSKTFAVPSGCTTYDNTATFTTNTTGTTGSDSQSVSVCKTITGGHTMGYWQNKNGQADIKKMGTSVCAALKTAYPNVLSALNCTSVSTFQSSVTAIINAANASGTGEPMFKGQFLATALSVKRTAALGTTKVAANPSLVGYACLTVNQLLYEGNARYATLVLDKAKLMAVKDYYDRINNNTAVTC